MNNTKTYIQEINAKKIRKGFYIRSSDMITFQKVTKVIRYGSYSRFHLDINDGHLARLELWNGTDVEQLINS